MQPFDFGGLTSQENTISVPIQTDKDGYLGRECPNPDCEEYFKIIAVQDKPIAPVA